VQCAHLVQLIVSHTLCRQFARQSLEIGQHFERVMDVGLGEAHGDRAAIGQQVDEAFPQRAA
jgi:hypothetical protein